MPTGWKPKENRIQELIAEEQFKMDAILKKRQWLPEPLPSFQTGTERQMLDAGTPPISGAFTSSVRKELPAYTPITLPERTIPDILSPQEKQVMGYQPPRLPKVGKNIPNMRQEAAITTPLARTSPTSVSLTQGLEPVPGVAKGLTDKEKEPSLPFWQRALQIFSAPFNWIDENIIKPGESLVGTGLGVTPEVKRESGEDFWEWKKRSWEAWETPGVNIKLPWRDEPWRIDAKGVLEFAPWLLIPGAGQVGTATRAGVGIAGMLGKAGKVGRALGGIVEYSPWGLVEKTAGVAIKGGFRAVGAVSERMSTAVGEKLYGKYIPPPVSPAVAKITKFTDEVTMPAFRKWQKESVKELRIRQQAAVLEVQLQQKRGEFPFSELKSREAKALTEVGGLKPEFALTPERLASRQAKEIGDIESAIANGEISEQAGKGLITRIKNSPAYKAVEFTPEEGKELGEMVLRASQEGLWSYESRAAFEDWIFQGLLPQKHNLEQWSEVFGRDFAKAVGKLDRSRVNTVIDTLGIGKSLISSMDLSATLRQGLILSLLHPTKVPVWFGRQVKALLSEKWALEMDDVMRANPVFQKWEARGAYFAPITEATARTAEEAFPSRFAERIPGIKRSSRAFNTYVNQARIATLEQAEASMVAQGANEAQLKLFAEFVNSASGRGGVPVSLEKYMPALNATLFSPRLQLATLQLPRQIGRMLISDNPYMRKEGAKALVTFVGGGVSLLGLLQLSGVSKIETDPRSGDFAKIKIGETRLDIWRGYVQYARFAAQLLSGERKSAYGNMNKAERSEIVSRFMQSKSAPIVGLLADILRGENYQGAPIFNDTTGFSKAARERIVPLAAQDVIDAMEMNGINGLWTAAPATLGIGVLTYVNDFVKVKEKIARETGYKSWDDIDPKTQREIENRNAELQAATIAYDRQMMGTAWGDWQLAGKAIDEVLRQNVENAINKYRQSGGGVQFREDISDVWTERRGAYKARGKEARFEDIVSRLAVEDDAESLLTLGPEQKALKVYNDALFGDDMYDEFGDYRYDEADRRKAIIRQSLSPELWQYIEDYQALRWETFPQEFRDLQEAKTLMKPYWAIADTVARLFGKRYAESKAGQALIARRRKQMRFSNPEIARAYERFYAQND